MGLKDDLIEAKVQSALAAGADPNDINTSVGSAIEVEADLTKEAIVNFLTKAEFRITQLAANVVLEDFNIPPQQADILPTVTSTDIPYPAGVPAAALPVPLNGGKNGVLTKSLNVAKDVVGLDSTGYVYIGGDPDSQDGFDVNTLDGIRDFTKVELLREDIEDLL